MGSRYLRLGLRYLARQKMYTGINVMGLAIGLACCILLFLYVRDEWRYDRFHERRDRIYRIAGAYRPPLSDGVKHGAQGPYRLATALRRDLPEIPHVVRFLPMDARVSYRGKTFYETRAFAVDPNVFEVFTFPLLRGDPRTALRQPFSVVITEAMAKKYFGDDDPMGKTLRADDQLNFTVTGILQPIPEHSHIHFDVLGSLPSIEPFLLPNQRETWSETTVFTYLLLPPNLPPQELEKRFVDLVDHYMGPGTSSKLRLYLQPLTDIHLRSHTLSEIEPNGDILYVYASVTLAIFVLLIACTNYMNLATARAAARAHEVALRKVVGATRGQLMLQFFGESIALTGVALVVALAGVEMALPVLNSLTGKSLALRYTQDVPLLGGLGLLVLGVGIVAGSYPAVCLSAFSPMAVFKGTMPLHLSGAWGRKILVVVQFTIATTLIIATGILYQQLHYMQTLPLGYTKAHTLVLYNRRRLQPHYDAFKATLLQHPHIISMALSSRVPPGKLQSNIPTRLAGGKAGPGLQTVWVDHDFLTLLNVDLLAGRHFSAAMPSDADDAFILNEAAVRALGWGDPIGQPFGSQYLQNGRWQWQHGRVIGVVRDIYHESLHQPIVPTVYFIEPDMAGHLIVRLNPQDIEATIAFIRQTWNRFTSGFPMRFAFLDAQVNQLYQTEQRQGQTLTVFTVLALIVAGLGLFGLSAFTTEQRTKEIGIHKALGASVLTIVVRFTWEFTRLVLVSMLLSWPLAYIVMQAWLQHFAYHITIGPGPFLLGGVIALLEAWGTVSLQALRAARANPIDALRYE